jgi:hypothetical protein
VATEINPSEIRFIKLGKGGSWEKDCIDSSTPTVRFGFENPHHQTCLDRDWNILDHFWREQGYRSTEITKIVNQTRDFYTLGSDALWITFYKRKLYWCFADEEVRELEPQGSRVRTAINGWRCTDINNERLFTDSLSGQLTMIQGFRGTICKVHASDYLISRINGRTPEDVQQTSSALEALKSCDATNSTIELARL